MKFILRKKEGGTMRGGRESGKEGGRIKKMEQNVKNLENLVKGVTFTIVIFLLV